MSKPQNRDKNGRFVKGNCGNPGGRPKQTEQEKDALALIRSLAPKAAEQLSAILDDEEAAPALKIKAIEIVLDRTYGKAPQQVEISKPKAEIAAEIADMLARRKKELTRDG